MSSEASPPPSQSPKPPSKPVGAALKRAWISSLLVVGFLLALNWMQAQKPQAVRVRRLAMDTLIEVTVYAPAGVDPTPSIEAALQRFEVLEQVFSSYRDDSALSRLQTQGTLSAKDAPEAFVELRKGILEALMLSKRTQGSFHPGLGGPLRAWGFGPTKEPVRAPPPPQTLEAFSKIDLGAQLQIGPSSISIAPPLVLDLGGYAKGLAVDQATRILYDAGFSAMVNAGGDLAVTGPKPDGSPWRIGIKHPRKPEGLLGTLTLSQGAVATSGDYERYFEFEGVRYHHLLSPWTYQPARDFQQVTVRARSCREADSLATALFVATPEHVREISSEFRYPFLLVDPAGKVQAMQGFSWNPIP